MIVLFFYLAAGLAFGLDFTLRLGPHFEKTTVRVLRRDGRVEEKETRNLGVFFLSLLFNVLMWPTFFAFRFVYVPIHDHRAKKYYQVRQGLPT